MGIYSGTICYLIFSYLAIKISLSTEDSILNWHIMTDHIISYHKAQCFVESFNTIELYGIRPYLAHKCGE